MKFSGVFILATVFLLSSCQENQLSILDFIDGSDLSSFQSEFEYTDFSYEVSEGFSLIVAKYSGDLNELIESSILTPGASAYQIIDWDKTENLTIEHELITSYIIENTEASSYVRLIEEKIESEGCYLTGYQLIKYGNFIDQALILYDPATQKIYIVRNKI